MVTALIFGKPVSRTGNVSASAKEKEKDDGIRERTAVKPSYSNNDHDLKRAHCQRQNDSSSSSSTNLYLQYEVESSNNLFGLPPQEPQNVYTATAQGGKILKRQGHESIPLTQHRQRTNWPPLTNAANAIGRVNTNGEKYKLSAAAAAAAAAVTVPTKAKLELEISEEEKLVKTFNYLKEYRKVHGRNPTASDEDKVNLDKWLAEQRYQFQKYVAGRESTISETRLDLLRSVGLFKQVVKNVDIKRKCMLWGCKRELGANESFYCAQHMNLNTSNVNNPSNPPNISNPSSKKRKSNNGEISTNPAATNGVPQHSLKSPPEETSNRGHGHGGGGKKVKLAAGNVEKKPPAKRYKSNNGVRELTANPTASANGTLQTMKSPPEEVSNRKDEDVMMKMVKLAAGAVAKEVQYLGLQSSTDHVESAIKRFAVEVYCPMLYSSKEQSMGKSSDSARVLLSTFLAIREMLLINAGKFFPFAGLIDSSTNKESVEESNLKLARDFASVVVQNAVKRLQRMSPDGIVKHMIPNQDLLFDQYLEASKSYDSKGEDFQFALGRLDATATYLNANGSKLSVRKSIMARTSFNYAREQHPLFQEDNTSVGRKVLHAAPNSCVVFVMGQSESVEKNDIGYSSVNVEARHVERKEARESRIRLLKRCYNEL